MKYNNLFGGKPKGGFEDDTQDEPCNHPEHKPPTHLYIPVGKRYRHICPRCGAEIVVRGSSITS